MNWINTFELLCYGITTLLLADILIRRRWAELRLFASAAIAGFILEMLAVRVTGIYYYNPDFYVSLGSAPYQFPFFGGLMWGGLTVCGLRIARKLNMSALMIALVTGWLIVSIDLLLDVAAIRLDGGFWVWEGRTITLDVDHHMFMSVIWVNYLGYLFETPAVAFFSMRAEKKQDRSVAGLILRTVAVGLGGVAIVGVASGAVLLMNHITDEWFACVAFIMLWDFILARVVARIWHGDLTLRGIKDWPLLIFWAAIYGYCLAALQALGILMTVPLYGILAMILGAGTLLLGAANSRQ